MLLPCKKTCKNDRGFSIIEFVITTLIIGSLLAVAFPLFYQLQKKARKDELTSVLASVTSTLEKRYQEQKNFPPVLDHETLNTPCEHCFSEVLPDGIKSDYWIKKSENEYLYSMNGNRGTPEKYEEDGDYKISYDANTGILRVLTLP